MGRPINYSEARDWAWQERLAQKAELRKGQEEASAWVVGGSLILDEVDFE
jgi:hypothetical protein